MRSLHSAQHRGDTYEFPGSAGPILQQYAGGQPAATDAAAHAHYDQISAAVPAHELAPVIGDALGSLSPQDLRDRVTASAAQMSTPQRASLVETLLSGLGPNVSSDCGRSVLIRRWREIPHKRAAAMPVRLPHMCNRSGPKSSTKP